MDRIQLQEDINTRINELKDKSNYNIPNFYWNFKDVFDNIPIDIIDIPDLFIQNFWKLGIVRPLEINTYDDGLKLVNSFAPVITKFDIDEYTCFYSFVNEFVMNDSLKDIMGFLKLSDEEMDKKYNEYIKGTNTLLDKYYSYIKLIKKKFSDSSCDINSFFTYLFKEIDNADIVNGKTLLNAYNYLMFLTYGSKIEFDINDRKAYKELLKYIRGKYKLYSHFKDLEYKEIMRCCKEIDKINEAVNILDSEIATGTISSEKKICKLILDDDLRNYFHFFIEPFNRNGDKYLNTEVCTRIRNDYDNYCNILNKYGLRQGIFSHRLVSIFTYNQLDAICDILFNKLGLRKYVVENVLSTSDIKRIFEVLKLHNDGFNINEGLFDLDSDCYDKAMSIYNNIVSYGINPTGMSEVLDCDSNLIDTNLKILKSYNLISYINSSNYEVLFSKFLNRTIDNILEMGCFDFLINNVSSLRDFNSRRLQVLKCIGTPVIDQETYDISMTTKHFFISDEYLNSYIESAVFGNHNINLNLTLDDLERFILPDNKLLYSIGGVLVSVNKVKRLLDKGKSIYESIVDGLIITDDEYNSMMDVLQPLQYNRN